MINVAKQPEKLEKHTKKENTQITVVGNAKTAVSVTAVTNGITEIYKINAQDIPGEDMILVQVSRKQILQSINMQKMKLKDLQ